jgi:osmotically-inducible protein OsmY
MHDVGTGRLAPTRASKGGTAVFATLLLLTSPVALAAATMTPSRGLDDSSVKRAIEDELRGDATVPGHSIDVEVRDGVVTLSGKVGTLLASGHAVDLARSTRGVRSVVSEVEVKPVARSDADIYRDIEEALAADPAANANEVKASVTRGVATLTGTVASWQEKQVVGRVVEGVRGVERIDNDLTFRTPPARPDSEIEAAVRERLLWDARVGDGLVDVAVNDGHVRLNGAVGSALERVYARDDAWVPGVRHVDDSGLEVDWQVRDRMRPGRHVVRTDDAIRQAVEDAFVYDPRVQSFKPRVRVDHGIVTLSGDVENAQARRAAGDDAHNTVGVSGVRNLLQVRPASPVDDGTITRNVERALSRDPMLDRYAIQVRTYGGEVTLSGDVDSRFERRRAADDTATVAGVIDVQNRLEVPPAVARSGQKAAKAE